MLLTTCPNCSAQFKVQPEQLNVRQGRVMCGRCRSVFNAFQSLTRVAESENETHPPALAAVLNVDDPPASVTDRIFVREEPLPWPEKFLQTDFPSDMRSNEPPLASPVVGEGRGIEDEIFQEVSPLSLSPLLPRDAENPGAIGDNILLAPSPGQRPAATQVHPRPWSFGAIVLLLGLTAQISYGYRSAIIQSYPQLRPAFVSVCEWSGCNLSWGRDDNAIRIEASDLIESPGKAGQIRLAVTLVNRGATRQDLPAMELKLTDNANQVILSRILLPHEYLGRMPAKDESLAPNVEMYVNLSIELRNKAQASGYGVRAFYN